MFHRKTCRCNDRAIPPTGKGKRTTIQKLQRALKITRRLQFICALLAFSFFLSLIITIQRYNLGVTGVSILGEIMSILALIYTTTLLLTTHLRRRRHQPLSVSVPLSAYPSPRLLPLLLLSLFDFLSLLCSLSVLILLAASNIPGDGDGLVQWRWNPVTSVYENPDYDGSTISSAAAGNQALRGGAGGNETAYAIGEGGRVVAYQLADWQGNRLVGKLWLATGGFGVHLLLMILYILSTVLFAIIYHKQRRARKRSPPDIVVDKVDAMDDRDSMRSQSPVRAGAAAAAADGDADARPMMAGIYPEADLPSYEDVKEKVGERGHGQGRGYGGGDGQGYGHGFEGLDEKQMVEL